jgi:hypothetical protein
VYAFTLGQGERGMVVTRQEEMWSWGDMIANAPLLVGWFYRHVSRPLAGRFFTQFFRLACVLTGGRVRPSRTQQAGARDGQDPATTSLRDRR